MPAYAADLTGIPRIVDGDTIWIGETKIRLHGIDAPETKQECSQHDGTSYRKAPSYAIKIRAHEATGNEVNEHKLKLGYVQTKKFNSKNFYFNEPSPDNGGWLAMTDMIRHEDFAGSFLTTLWTRPWVGFSLEKEGMDFTVQLPEPTEKTLFTDVNSCSITALENVMKEFEGK